jgi:N-acylneuraminate cytidylyltransferase
MPDQRLLDPAACLAVIPARGGSKRVPGKNVRSLAGRPAIAYTIDAALESGVFGRVVVSTDSESIAEIARRCGAEAPFLRPPSLADDRTPVSAATVDALERVDVKHTTAAVCQLMANCPLRTSDDVRASHAAFAAGDAPSQLSVTRYGWLNPWWAMRLGPHRELEPVFPDRAQQRSQDLPEVFCITGAIWWASADVLRRERTYHVAGRSGWELPWQRAVDIDSEDDWLMAEVLLARALDPVRGDDG